MNDYEALVKIEGLLAGAGHRDDPKLLEAFQIANFQIAMKPRNPIWLFHPETGVFTTEVSQLNHDKRDPWNRSFDVATFVRHHHDAEGEIQKTDFDCYVGGKKVILSVFNT